MLVSRDAEVRVQEERGRRWRDEAARLQRRPRSFPPSLPPYSLLSSSLAATMSFMPAPLPPGPSSSSQAPYQHQQHDSQGPFHSPFQRAASGDITHLPGQRAQTVGCFFWSQIAVDFAVLTLGFAFVFGVDVFSRSWTRSTERPRASWRSRSGARRRTVRPQPFLGPERRERHF